MLWMMIMSFEGHSPWTLKDTDSAAPTVIRPRPIPSPQADVGNCNSADTHLFNDLVNKWLPLGLGRFAERARGWCSLRPDRNWVSLETSIGVFSTALSL